MAFQAVDPTQRTKSRASFIKQTQKFWDKRLKEKEDNKHAALVERRVNSLLDEGRSFEDISSDTGLGTSSIEEFVGFTRPGYGEKKPGKSIVGQVGDFSNAVVDRVGGGIVRSGIRLGGNLADVFTGNELKRAQEVASGQEEGSLTGGGKKAAEEFINKYGEVNVEGENRLGDFDKNSFGGRAGNIVGTGIKAGVDIAGISKAGSATRAATSATSKAGKVGSFVAGSGAETAAFSGIVTGQGNEVNIPREAGVGLLVDIATRGASKGIKSIWARKAGQTIETITDEARLLPEHASITNHARRIGDGKERIVRRLQEIDDDLTSISRGRNSVTKPVQKNLSNLGDTELIGGGSKDLSFQGKRHQGKLVTSEATTNTTVTPKATTTKSRGAEARELIKERADLRVELDKVNTPHPEIERLTKELDSIEAKIGDVQQGKTKMDAIDARKLMRERARVINEIQNPAQKAQQQAGRTFVATEIPKEAGRVKRAVITIKGRFSNMGRGGKEMSSRLDEAEFVSETAQGRWIQSIPTVRKLSKKEFIKFVDTLDALDKGNPVKMTPKIQQAVDEYTRLMPGVLREASEAGIEVAGDRGKYFFPKSYSQLNNKKGIDRAAKHLVKTGQAENLGQAAEQLRQVNRSVKSRPYGHLELHRQLDLDEYDKTGKALFEYLGFSGDRVGRASMFGAKDEVAQQLIDEIGNAGYSVEGATKLYRIAQGDEILGGETRQRLSSIARQFNTWRSLKKAAISNAGQTTNTATVAGWLNTAKGGLKSLSKKQKKFITETGVTADAVINNMAQQHGISGLAGRVSAPAFGAVEKFNRIIAASAGDVWAQKLAKRGSPKSLQQLRRLGVTGDIGGVLTNKQRTQAARKLVERAQFKISAKDLPAFAASPEGKLAIQFRTFTYKQTGFMYNEILKPLSQGDVRPLLRYSAALPVGFAVYKGRNMLSSKVEKGKDYSEEDEWSESVIGAYESLGAFGIGGDVKFAAEQFGRPGTGFEEGLAGTIGGPTGGFVAGTLFDIGDARSGQSTGLVRRAIESVGGPAGKAISNRVAPFPNKSLTNAMSDKELAKEIDEVSEESGYNPRLPSKTQRGRELNSDEYDKYAEEYAALWSFYYQKAKQVPGFSSASPATKKRMLSQVTRLAGSDARDRVLGEEGGDGRPKLPQDLETDKLTDTFKGLVGQ